MKKDYNDAAPQQLHDKDKDNSRDVQLFAVRRAFNLSSLLVERIFLIFTTHPAITANKIHNADQLS